MTVTAAELRPGDVVERLTYDATGRPTYKRARAVTVERDRLFVDGDYTVVWSDGDTGTYQSTHRFVSAPCLCVCHQPEPDFPAYAPAHGNGPCVCTGRTPTTERPA